MNRYTILRHKSILQYNSKNQKSYFITSPIYYSNDKPHIGHFYTNCLADVFTRWNRLKGNKVLFSTGTDDHGIKIQKAAEKQNVSCQNLVDSSAHNFKTLFDSAEMSYTDFIRTSETRHKKTVADIWRSLDSKKCFKKGKYSGWYSIVDECFISKSEIREVSDNLIEWQEEDNWIFTIEQLKPEILKWIESGVIYPTNVLPEIYKNIDELNTFSVSRPSSRIQWGVPVPDDPDQTIYVWFEALINYLTVSQAQNEKIWPVDMHVIGKDIMKFHTILWPAILLSLNLELPRKILIHSHWLKDGFKMSKSLGNVVDPHEEAKILAGYENLKFFLLSEDAVENDSDYDTERAIQKINNNLVNVTGNLLSRMCSDKINPHKKLGVDMEITDDIFPGKEYKELVKGLEDLRRKFECHMENMQLHFAINSIINVLRMTNVFFQSQEPWKSVEDERFREVIIFISSESLRMSAILLQCFVPNLSDKILNRLSVPVDQRTLEHVHFKPQESRNARLLHDLDGKNTLLKRIVKER